MRLEPPVSSASSSNASSRRRLSVADAVVTGVCMKTANAVSALDEGVGAPAETGAGLALEALGADDADGAGNAPAAGEGVGPPAAGEPAAGEPTEDKEEAAADIVLTGKCDGAREICYMEHPFSSAETKTQGAFQRGETGGIYSLSATMAGAALAVGSALLPRDLSIPNIQDRVEDDEALAATPFPERVMVRVVVITSVIVTAPESGGGWVE